MTLDGDDQKIKIVHFDETNDFHVEHVFILGNVNYTFCHLREGATQPCVAGHQVFSGAIAGELSVEYLLHS